MIRKTPSSPRGAASTAICRAELSTTGVDLVVTMEDRIVQRTQVSAASEQRLSEMISRHRLSFDADCEMEPYGMWASATERFLAEVHQLLVTKMLPLLAGFPRVELAIEDPLLRQLPWETATAPGTVALFETCQIYRGALNRTTTSAFPFRRQFYFDLVTVETTALPGVIPEAIISSALYSRQADLPTHRMLHVAGHRPATPARRLSSTECAHLVLSGCESLPDTLPPGALSATGSLWAVDDESNAVTMSLFHARVAAGVGPLEALRQAQLWQRALSPTVWAAYVHLGHPD